MFAKMRTTISNAVKTAWKGVVSAAKKVAYFTFDFSKKTAKFVKLNILGSISLTIKAALFLKSFFSRGIAIGGLKHAVESVAEKANEFKTSNPATFKKLAVVASSVCLVMACILSVVFFNFNTMAVSVITNGQVVGYVADSSELDAIMSGVNNMLADGSDESAISEITFGIALVPKSCVSKGKDLSAAVLVAQDNVSPAVGLYVDGELVTCTSSEQVINDALDLRVAKYLTEDTQEYSILDEVEIKTVYCANTHKVSDDEAVALITDEDKLPLRIQTTDLTSTLKPLSFETVVKYDASKVYGYNRVSVPGKEGSMERSEKITSINGEVVETVLLEEKLIESPVDQIVVKGTGSAGVSTVQPSLAGSGISFVWPIAKTSRMYISSYFGGSRGHGGIDITGPQGTPIYAGAEGTVSFAGWSGDYGYLIVINHKGGYQTAYAHMSAIYVQAGQSVAAGQVIAACGSTGIATGPHIHFEVRIGGVRVNPAPYLGIS